jgi:hypothetical protein
MREPYIRWLTSIWHPNIERLTPHRVCTNSIDSWWPGRDLTDLVLTLGDMVQFKQYHAAAKPPFPYDPEVAKWVEEYAEPNGIVSKDNPVDHRPLLPSRRVRAKSRASARKTKLGSSTTSAPQTKSGLSANEASSPAPVSRHVRLGPKT